MATTRLREKSPKKSSSENQEIGAPTTRSTRQRTKKIKSEPEDDCDSNDAEYASLNVLAQVATATLEKEPNSSSAKSKKLSKRSIQTLEALDLDQIKRLSDKCLLSFFSEFTANEMTRNFVYSCHLIPKKCQEKFKSFGNESQARMKIKAHLNEHIEHLTEEAKSKKGPKFTAEPLHIRDKRLAEMAGKPRKKGSFNIANVLLGNPANRKNNYTVLKPNRESIQKNDLIMTDFSTVQIKSEKKSESESEDREEEYGEQNGRMTDDENYTNVTKENTRSTGVKRSRRQKSRVQSNYSNDKDKSDSENKRIMAKRKKSKKKRILEEESDDSLQDDTERRIEENEQFIIDLLSRTQPHHDHCYTTIFGKKKSIESIDVVDELDDAENDDVNDENNILYQGKEIIYPEKISEPILCLGNVSVMDELTGTGSDEASKTIIVCSEEILDDTSKASKASDGDQDHDGHSGQRPYPPMPKLSVTKRGRIEFPEEDEPVSEEEGQVLSPRKKKKGSSESIGSADWERRTALKCIRELKSRKAKEDALLFCRICKDKKFTASATLMYHYRSHAGIKPFVCLICNTTFTRQHSLNYHMLIHNNQSRFTCKDCGRKFRHPSHFKEHLRRHTGETPFICMDCPQKFKTRNTYKRHLRTRHGKLLTAAGIRILSVEEFAKIRTKPYRRTPDRVLKNRGGKNVKVVVSMNDQEHSDDDSDTDHENVSVIENEEIHDHQLHAGETFENSDIISHPESMEDNNQQGPAVQHSSMFVPVGIIVNS